MRGAGRTPRGLRAHQKASRAADGTAKSVAPAKLAEASPKTSKTNATQPSARIARRTASGPRLRRVRIQGRVIRNGRPPNQAERRSTSDAPSTKQSFLKPTNGQPNTSSRPPNQREQTASHFKGCNEFSRRFGGGVLRIQDPPHLHQQRSSKGARWST